VRTARLLAALEAEAAAVPDPWSLAAAAAREVLDERAGRPREFLGLSVDACAVLGFLHGAEQGRTFLVRLIGVVPDEVNFIAGFAELVEVGLLEISHAVDEDGEQAETIVTLRYDVDLPGTA
jgi:hypothetical protein